MIACRDFKKTFVQATFELPNLWLCMPQDGIPNRRLLELSLRVPHRHDAEDVRSPVVYRHVSDPNEVERVAEKRAPEDQREESKRENHAEMIQDVADTLEMFRKELNHGPHFLVSSKPSEERLLLIPFQPRSKRAYDDEQERNSPDDEVDDDWLPPNVGTSFIHHQFIKNTEIVKVSTSDSSI